MSTYGICFLSVIPLRAEASDRAEIVSQLLFGDAFEILETAVEEKWTKIRNAYDDYEGWIDSKHIKEIPYSEFTTIKNEKSLLVADTAGVIKKGEIEIPVFIGTPLPFFKNDSGIIAGERYEYKGQVLGDLKNHNFTFLKSIAFKYLNAPYLWGGKGLFGIDCSGFVQQVFRLCGYQLPRDAYQQAESGIAIGFKELLPGDLAFFSNANGKITHVGIILENNEIIHASGQVRVDVLEEKGIFNREKNIYSHNFHSIKRIFA